MIPLLPTSFLPSIAWFSILWTHETVCLEACEHFQKGSLRNRCYIAGPNGMQRLSIPLAKGKHQQMPIREVRIAYDEPWQRQHWRSIRTAYGNAPFFEHYADELAPFFERRFEFLFDFNSELCHLLLKKWGWKGALTHSAQYLEPGHVPPGTDFRSSFSDVAGKIPDWFCPLPYPQVFGDRMPFLPNLSALDLLFCCGKQAREVLAYPHSITPSLSSRL